MPSMDDDPMPSAPPSEKKAPISSSRPLWQPTPSFNRPTLKPMSPTTPNRVEEKASVSQHQNEQLLRFHKLSLDILFEKKVSGADVNSWIAFIERSSNYENLLKFCKDHRMDDPRHAIFLRDQHAKYGMNSDIPLDGDKCDTFTKNTVSLNARPTLRFAPLVSMSQADIDSRFSAARDHADSAQTGGSSSSAAKRPTTQQMDL